MVLGLRPAPKHAVERVALEAGPLSQWLHAGLTKGGFETVLLDVSAYLNMRNHLA